MDLEMSMLPPVPPPSIPLLKVLLPNLCLDGGRIDPLALRLACPGRWI